MEGEHQSELQWREGIVYNPASSYDETWNDQEILDVRAITLPLSSPLLLGI